MCKANCLLYLCRWLGHIAPVHASLHRQTKCPVLVNFVLCPVLTYTVLRYTSRAMLILCCAVPCRVHGPSARDPPALLPPPPPRGAHHLLCLVQQCICEVGSVNECSPQVTACEHRTLKNGILQVGLHSSKAVDVRFSTGACTVI
jgi:hypothetical protein